MTVAGLRPGTVVVHDAIAKNDTVLIAKGRQVDEVLIRRLQNFAERIGVQEPFLVACRSSKRLSHRAVRRSLTRRDLASG